MPNEYLDTTLVDKAIIFATNAHKNTGRRGKSFPYIIHPLEAMSIVATMSNNPILLAAAVLHDVVEDTDATIEDIRKEFGEEVASLVEYETIQADKDLSWRERKQIAIDHVRDGTIDFKMVALGDKLSNLRAIHNDYLDFGDKIWSRFGANNKDDVAWYYKSLLHAFDELKNAHAYQEYASLIEKTFK
ncbi:MAG: bifunctional (p)ppGpp synthetase/guanosine-3',5'-bis(diphosphate) 3'-pyrophosphohydrolase [Bacilli bacterium]|nr:bifunctional (p)ppGpp synthetase/guanosine-3',5'-bis(diphosphate) 3'-pyrophosphohydrolase [Bacilli bacterium]